MMNRADSRQMLGIAVIGGMGIRIVSGRDREVGIVRDDGLEVFTHPERVLTQEGARAR